MKIFIFFVEEKNAEIKYERIDDILRINKN